MHREKARKKINRRFFFEQKQTNFTQIRQSKVEVRERKENFKEELPKNNERKNSDHFSFFFMWFNMIHYC
jgi:hypothetical protein